MLRESEDEKEKKKEKIVPPRVFVDLCSTFKLSFSSGPLLALALALAPSFQAPWLSIPAAGNAGERKKME